VTSTIKVATGITLVAQRDPIWLAKEVASLDMISGGRFILGIGYGWNIEEMEHHGVPTKRRRAVVREKMLAMKELWTKDEASFSGTYVNFEPSWAWPKPVQQPHPPILIGAAPTEVTFRHVVEYADGWMPIEGRWPIGEKLTELRKAAEAADRDPDSLTIGVFGIRPDAGHIEEQMGVGVTLAALNLPSAPRDKVLSILDRYVPLIERFHAS
jgi:probable F420-dependent oxidoreductase